MKNRRVVLCGLLCLAGCGLLDDPPPDTDPAVLRLAPYQVTVEGQRLRLNAGLYRDPMIPAGGRAQQYTFFEVRADGGGVYGVEMETGWVVHEDGLWEIDAFEEIVEVALYAPHLAGRATGGPRLALGSRYYAVVRLRNAQGQTWLLRTPEHTVKTAA